MSKFVLTEEELQLASTSLEPTRPVSYWGPRSEKLVYFCRRCCQGFYTDGSLTIHTKNWHLVKPFKCYIQGCRSTFDDSDELQYHLLLHMRTEVSLSIQNRKKGRRSFQKTKSGKGIKTSECKA